MEIVRVAASVAASGTFDIAGSETETPVGAIFSLTSAIADDTITADAKISWGATDGVKQFCMNVSNVDGVGATSTDRMAATDACVALHDGAANLDFKFSFNSFIAGGVRLNIDSQASEGYLIVAKLFYATDVDEFAVDNIGLGSTTAAINYTGLGFEFDGMLTGHCYSSAGNNVHSGWGRGVVVNDISATPSQKSVGFCGNSGAGSGDQNTYVSDDRALCAPLYGSLRWKTLISDVDATGFTHTTSASSSAYMFIVAFKKAAGISFDVFDISWPTTGNLVESGLSFEPGVVELTALQGPPSLNTLSTVAGNMSFSEVTFDSSAVFTISVTDDDGADPIVAKSLSSDQIRILDHDGAANAVLSSSRSLDSNGYTITPSTYPGDPILGFGWAMSGGAAGPSPVTGDLSKTLDDATVSATGTQAATVTQVTLADLNKTLDAATLSAGAGWGVYALSYTTTEDATLVSVAAAQFANRTADLDKTLDAATLESSGVGSLSTVGVTDVTLDDAIVSSVASLLAFAARTGDLFVTLDDAGLNAVGVGVPFESIVGDLNVTLDDAAVVSTITQNISTIGEVSVVLANAALSATATREESSDLAVALIQLEDATLESTGSLIIYPFDSTNVSGLRTAHVTALGITNNLQVKDPDATLDFGVDWSEWLNDVNDTIAVSEWVQSDQLSVTPVDSINGMNVCWVSGGIPGRAYKLTNRIRTVGGRVSDCTIYIRSEQQ